MWVTPTDHIKHKSLWKIVKSWNILAFLRNLCSEVSKTEKKNYRQIQYSSAVFLDTAEGKYKEAAHMSCSGINNV